MLGSACIERRKIRLIIREIIFEKFQRMTPQSTNVTDRRTNGQLTMTIPCYASNATLRAVKKLQNNQKLIRINGVMSPPSGGDVELQTGFGKPPYCVQTFTRDVY